VKIQLLSDLHLETESFEATPAPGAELLVLAGDIDATWAGYAQFADWPVPVLVVAGNHEFDGRDLQLAWPAFRAHCAGFGLRLIEREAVLITDTQGQVVRFLGTVRWSDFGLFGDKGRERAERAGNYFQRVMGASRGGAVFDVAAVREEGLACRAWLEAALMEPPRGRWQRTVAITHFAPSLRSADPRYGQQPGTASFCNADDDLIPRADLWLHGHLHCRHDYAVPRAGLAPTHVICQARGLVSRREHEGLDTQRLLTV
jgi:Calcineurin-like phosphoesterase